MKELLVITHNIWRNRHVDLAVNLLLDETNVSTETGKLLNHSKESSSIGEDGWIPIVEIDDVSQGRFQWMTSLFPNGESRRAVQTIQLTPNTFPL